MAVCDEANRVQGVFTDGDLRRWLVAGGTLNDGVTRAMTRNGVTLQADSRAVEAKERLMKHKISAAPVVDENGQLVGAINLQNFLPVRGSFKTQTFRQPMQVGDVQFQRSGGRRPVALVSLQRAANGFSLKRVGRLAQIDVFPSRAPLPPSQSATSAPPPQTGNAAAPRTTSSPASGGPRQHHRPMDSMLQFAHVARPRTTSAAGFAPPQPK